MKTNAADNNAMGDLSTPGAVRIVRTLPGPIERVWAYLTDPEKRARWFCGGATGQEVGSTVVFAMHHKKLAPDETPAPEFAHVQDPGVTFEGRVLRYEPPRLLAFTFGSDESEVTFELTPQGKSVQLVLTHRTRGEERADLGNYSSGWHTHLNLLIAELEGAPRPPFWPTHLRLKQEYARRLAAVTRS